MRYLGLIFLVAQITISGATSAQKKMKWKPFLNSFQEQLDASNTHFSAFIDLKNRNEINGMPTSNTPLFGSQANFIEPAAYQAFYTYEFESKDQAKAMFDAMFVKLKANYGKDFLVHLDDVLIDISKDGEEQGDYPTASIELMDNKIIVVFGPPINLPIPY